MKENILEIKNLSKSFGENTVLKDINFNIKEGEIIGLVGENGAGKSTLMKIIFGMSVIKDTGGYRGEIKVNGKVVNFSNPFEALEEGIGMVHQEFSLIPGFKASENIVLNRESTKKSFLENFFGEGVTRLDVDANTNRSEKAIDKLGLKINSEEVITNMPVAHMQFIEIAREIEREKTKLLILDEPTAVLTEKESEILIETIKKLSKKGISIIFITHRLDEIIEACDKVVVLRDGLMIKSIPTSETNVEEITQWMIGRKVESNKEKTSDKEIDEENIILELKNFNVDMPGERVKNLNLKVRKGEILGLAGMAGQGKIGIANGVMGLYLSSGEVKFKGEDIKTNLPAEPLKKGMFFVSEDRKGVGLILDESISMNIAYPSIQIKKQFLKSFGKVFNYRDIKEITNNANDYIKKLKIKCMDSEQRVAELSGGNQQKVCLAKAFTMDPELMFVSEPTRGIDVGAKKLVLDILEKYNKENKTTIIITSSEVEELRMICDRIAVVNEGKVAAILPATADIIEIGKHMVGVGGDK
ncbi:MAG: sugar ABC transporter ATP-binding protein [Fusobacterium sp. JB021]|nr:sugar ABC transporter ATP-binding protein [Fusobacterium sp. JB021]